MKVLPIFSQNNQFINNKNIKNKTNPQTSSITNYQLNGIPRSYIAFKGGATLDLYKTFALLHQKQERDGIEQEPFLIRKAILKEFEQRNSENKTLIDIHKEVYGNILNANDLNEIKSMYPTFRLVKKLNDVDFKDNAFIAEIKRGDNPIFNNKEDLSVQLIKLYWGEGFSLSDIAKQAKTKPSTICAVMEKLNIERVTPYYGKLLKLSDKEYNERFTREISERMEIIAAQKRGEPYIPRKPLTKEQKQHISESLIKFYANNPERITEISERQKEFFKNHPEAAIIFKFVMIKAWNMNSCCAVRRKLKSFLLNNNIQLEKGEQEPGIEYLSRLQSAKMKTFWDTHPYEKKKFSKGIETAWEKINTHKNIDLIKKMVNVPLLPSELVSEMKNWMQTQDDKKIKNVDIKNFNLPLSFQLFPLDVIIKTNEYNIINNFFMQNREKSAKFNNAISTQIMGICNYYENEKSETEVAQKISTYMKQELQGRKKISLNDTLRVYAQLLSIILDYGTKEDFDKALKAYDLTYNCSYQEGVKIMQNL